MARDMERKAPKKVMAEYTCPECGKTQTLVVCKKRQRCPECSKEKNRRDSRERLSNELKTSIKIKNEGLEPAVVKKPELSDEEKAYRKQVKQCTGCHWWRSCDGGSTHLCHYYIRHGLGFRRDPGNGPGDCRSFESKKRLSRKQMVEEARKLLEQIEKDCYAQQPRKGDGADG